LGGCGRGRMPTASAMNTFGRSVVVGLLPWCAFRRGGPFAVTGSGVRGRIGRGVRGRIRGADGSGGGSGGGSARGRICK